MDFKDSIAIQLIEDKLGCGFWKRNVGADEMQWSRGLFRLYGRDPERDRASYTLMRQTQHPEDRLTFDKIDGNVRAGTVFDREYRVVLRDGNTRRLAHRGRVIFNSKGEPAFDVAVVWNVADRKQLLEEVLAEERRVRVILEALDLFIRLLQTGGFDVDPVVAQSAFFASLNQRR
jgi:PAS domain-containing protein